MSSSLAEPPSGVRLRRSPADGGPSPGMAPCGRGRWVSGDPRGVGLSTAQPEDSVCGSLYPLLAPVPRKDSTWLGAFIKFLFFNYMLIVTNPNNTNGGDVGRERPLLPLLERDILLAWETRSCGCGRRLGDCCPHSIRAPALSPYSPGPFAEPCASVSSSDTWDDGARLVSLLLEEIFSYVPNRGYIISKSLAGFYCMWLLK